METLAYCNEIVTDKTGVLTMNRMGVITAFMEEAVHKDFAALKNQEFVKKSIVFTSEAEYNASG